MDVDASAPTPPKEGNAASESATTLQTHEPALDVVEIPAATTTVTEAASAPTETSDASPVAEPVPAALSSQPEQRQEQKELDAEAPKPASVPAPAPAPAAAVARAPAKNVDPAAQAAADALVAQIDPAAFFHAVFMGRQPQVTQILALAKQVPTAANTLVIPAQYLPPALQPQPAQPAELPEEPEDDGSSDGPDLLGMYSYINEFVAGPSAAAADRALPPSMGAATQLARMHDPQTGRSLIQVAVERSHRALVPVLMAAGADVNAQDAQGRTAVHSAVRLNQLKLVKTWLDELVAYVKKHEQGAWVREESDADAAAGLAAQGAVQVVVKKTGAAAGGEDGAAPAKQVARLMLQFPPAVPNFEMRSHAGLTPWEEAFEPFVAQFKAGAAAPEPSRSQSQSRSGKEAEAEDGAPKKPPSSRYIWEVPHAPRPLRELRKRYEKNVINPAQIRYGRDWDSAGGHECCDTCVVM